MIERLGYIHIHCTHKRKLDSCKLHACKPFSCKILSSYPGCRVKNYLSASSVLSIAYHPFT